MSYKSIFQDVRGSVDYILMEGNHKKKTCESMSKYVHKDDNLPVLMRRIQAAGRKTFLLTNSEWDFLFFNIHFLGGGVVSEVRQRCFSSNYEDLL